MIKKIILPLTILIIVLFAIMAQAAEKVTDEEFKANRIRNGAVRAEDATSDPVKVRVKVLDTRNHLPITDAQVCVIYASSWEGRTEIPGSCSSTNERGETNVNVDRILSLCKYGYLFSAWAGGYKQSFTAHRNDNPKSIKRTLIIYLASE